VISTSPVSIQKAAEAEAPQLIEFLRQMLADMAAVGGYPVATGSEHWANVESEFLDHLQSPDCLHLLVKTATKPHKAVGWALARMTEREPLFEPARVLHIHALYVSPAYRRQGIGRSLLKTLLEWGRKGGCVEAELNVLVGNPARALYQGLGFSLFEIEMTRKL